MANKHEYTIVVIPAKGDIIIRRVYDTDDGAARQAHALAKARGADENWHVVDGWPGVELDGQDL